MERGARGARRPDVPLNTAAAQICHRAARRSIGVAARERNPKGNREGDETSRKEGWTAATPCLRSRPIGITRALSYQVASDVRAGRLVVVLPQLEPPPIPVHVVHASGAEPPARVRAFIDHAVGKLRADERLDADKWIG